MPLAFIFFLRFFALFLGFCGRVGRIAAGAAGTRLDCHLTVLWQLPRVLGAALERRHAAKVCRLGAATPRLKQLFLYGSSDCYTRLNVR